MVGLVLGVGIVLSATVGHGRHRRFTAVLTYLGLGR